MVNQDDSIVNGIKYNINQKEEIMIPYPSVLYIAWDKDVGKKLQTLRNECGISQVKLAELTDGAVSKRTVIALEGGEVNAVSREKLDILLKILGYDVRSLFPSVTVKDFKSFT